MTLNGKIAIVTGGTRGIGLGIAECLADAGARVVAASRSEPGEPFGEGISWQLCNVADAMDADELLSGVMGEFGRLDILVNNAGIQIEKTVEDMSDDDYNELMDINARGVFVMCRGAVPRMRKSGGGAIINIGSVSGNQADASMALYNASKAFVHGLTRSVAVDHGVDGIRCNAISPGWIATGMVDDAFALSANPDAAKTDALARHAVGRLGTPRDIGKLAVFLVSDDAAFITGQCFVADGGLTAASPINPSLF